MIFRSIASAEIRCAHNLRRGVFSWASVLTGSVQLTALSLFVPLMSFSVLSAVDNFATMTKTALSAQMQEKPVESKVVCADQPDDPALFNLLRQPKSRLANGPARLCCLWNIRRINIRLRARRFSSFLGHLVQQRCRLYFLHTNPRSITPRGEF